MKHNRTQRKALVLDILRRDLAKSSEDIADELGLPPRGGARHELTELERDGLVTWTLMYPDRSVSRSNPKLWMLKSNTKNDADGELLAVDSQAPAHSQTVVPEHLDRVRRLYDSLHFALLLDDYHSGLNQYPENQNQETETE